MKMSTQFTIWFIAFNAAAGIMLGLGVADDLGINVETGSPDQIEQVTTEEDVSLGNNVGGTLFGMYNQLTNQLGNIFYAVLPGMKMLKIFVPDIFVDALLTPLATLIATKDVIAFARGTDV